MIKKVLGIGGVFFKTKNPVELKSWYTEHLGIPTDQYGHLFESEEENGQRKAYLQWSPMSENSDHFSPSEKEFMINYRVANLEKLMVDLQNAGGDHSG